MHRGLVLLFLVQIVEIRSHTLYQWLIDSKTEFNYDTNPKNRLGVYNWEITYPDSCAGEFQSPVNIQTDKVRYDETLSCPQMIYTSSVLRGVLRNNGLSATFEPESEMSYRLTNIPFRPGIFNLNDFHFHFGGLKGRMFERQGQRFRGDSSMSAGSEHTIDGLRFEGEVHFVFYNSEYKNLETADNKTDGVVVVSILVQKVPDNTVENGGTASFSDFLERNIPRVIKYKQNATAEVDLSMFFNRECEFYTYFGSTTTPQCREAVRWLILREPIKVRNSAWFQLIKLESRGDFNIRFGNYRNIQPLNGRIIEANFPRVVGPVLPSPNGEFIRPKSRIFGGSGRGPIRRRQGMFSNNAMRMSPMFENNVMRVRRPMVLNDRIRGQSQLVNARRFRARSRLPMRNDIRAPRNLGIQGPPVFMPRGGSFRRPGMVNRQILPEARLFIMTDYQRLPSRSIYSRRENFMMAPEPGFIMPPMRVATLRGSKFALPTFHDQPIAKGGRSPPSERIRPCKYRPMYKSYNDGLWKRLCDFWHKKYF